MELAIGYRAWRISDSRLLSLVTPLVWQPQQVQQARCLGETIVAPYLRDPWRSLLPQHPAPSSSCSCGFYAAYHLADLLKSRFGRSRNARCLGAIAAWGRVVLHREGFRAESVQILGLLLPAKDASNGDIASTVPTVGRAYGVPVFLNARDLEAYASEFGSDYSPEPRRPPSRLTRLLRHLTD